MLVRGRPLRHPAVMVSPVSFPRHPGLGGQAFEELVGLQHLHGERHRDARQVRVPGDDAVGPGGPSEVKQPLGALSAPTEASHRVP